MDGSTPEGRRRCWEHKNHVVQIQKAFDELKKSQTKHLKDEATRIDKMGKKANDLCEELKAAIMKPRIEWEAKEAERIQNHREAIRYIQETGFPNVLINSPLPDLLATYEDAKTRLNVVEVGKGFEEFEEEAFKVYNEAVANVSTNIAVIKDQIEKAERLAELEAAEAKRLKEAEDERLRLEGEERAKQKLKEEQEAEAISEVKPKGWISKEFEEEPEAEEPTHVLAPISEAAQEALTQPQSHDLGHKRNVNRSIRDALVTVAGITESEAQAIVTAVYYGEIEHLTIQY